MISLRRGPVATRSGFTFLEIMVVVVVMAAMMAMVIPMMGGFTDGARLKSSARTLANILKVARTEAVFGARTTEVILDLNENAFRIDLREPEVETRAQRLSSSRTRGKRRLLEQDRPLETRVRFEEVTAASPQVLNDSKIVVRFFADGTATPTLITLINHRSQRTTLEVIRATGLTEVTPGSIQDKKAKAEADLREGEG